MTEMTMPPHALTPMNPIDAGGLMLKIG